MSLYAIVKTLGYHQSFELLLYNLFPSYPAGLELLTIRSMISAATLS